MSAKTISILLLDGSPLGVRIADIGNTVAQAIAIPRKQWNEVKNSDALAMIQSPGVYFLMSNPSDDGRFKIYIGQSANVRIRIDGHMNDSGKDFWNIAVCFVSRGSGINTAHIEYLEHRCCDIAKTMGRAEIQNKTQPMKNTLGAADKVRADDFLTDIRLLLATLGFPILEERITERNMYVCKNKFGAEGKGYYTNEGFLVLKGSTARKIVAKHLMNVPFRRHLLEEGVLRDTGEFYVFTRDYLFSAPSAAADALLGGSVNGWLAWKDKDGKTLNENVRQPEPD
ncbi:MAG: GIY-YIG nuclease family protein [Candidatus Peribacteraceae bacterium]|nr:GIY-YIG nuclease family protein [Candidatus Peribacteraceae bacterium]